MTALRWLGLLLLGAGAAAQDAKAPVFTLPAGEVGVGRLIEEAARCLRINVVRVDRQDERPLVLAAPVQADARGCRQVLDELLRQRNLVLMPLDAQLQLYLAISLKGPRHRLPFTYAPLVTPQEVLAQPAGKRIVLTILPLASDRATAIASAMNAQLAAARTPNQPQVAALANGRGLMLVGFQDEVAKLMAQAQEQDRAPAPPAKEPQRDLGFTARLHEIDQQIGELEKQLAELKQKSAGK